MSCFWDTLINRLKKEDISKLLNITDYTPKVFSNALKNENKKIENVLWNGNTLSEKEKIENFEHIKEYDINTIKNGYLCSTCDPFLILLSEIFQIKIIHHYDGVIINYENQLKINNEITIHSNKGHMW